MDTELMQLEEEYCPLKKPQFKVVIEELGSLHAYPCHLPHWAVFCGLYQSLISGANLIMPMALHLSDNLGSCSGLTPSQMNTPVVL